MTTPIIFYDIPSTLPTNAWSPNTWKARYALNIKGVPYKTEYVEYPDIAALAVQIGAPPTGTKDDGSPMYTLPIIQDPNTGAVISDSYLIAQYLDTTYPGGNTLFPPGTKALIDAFEAAYTTQFGAAFPLLLAVSHGFLNPRSAEYFRVTREAKFGKTLEEFSPLGPIRDADLAKAKEGFAVVDSWLAKNGGGPYVMGNTVSYADGILAGYLQWISLVLPTWADLASWNNGRWGAYLAAMQTYATVA